MGGRGIPRTEGFGTTNDLHDLGGNCVLTGAVHNDAEIVNQLFGVICCRLHCSLPEGVLRRSCVQQCGIHTSFDIPRDQRVENGGWIRFEFVVSAAAIG